MSKFIFKNIKMGLIFWAFVTVTLCCLIERATSTCETVFLRYVFDFLQKQVYNDVNLTSLSNGDPDITNTLINCSNNMQDPLMIYSYLPGKSNITVNSQVSLLKTYCLRN